MTGYHFLQKNCRTRYSNELVTPGSVLTERRAERCARGPHASTRILDALASAPGPVLCRVAERECIWLVDIEPELHEFACWCAERALSSAGVTDGRAWNAIRVKRLWLAGEATDDDLAAASEAAWSAARSSSCASACDAARAAAGGVAVFAAWYAARSAAWAAALGDVLVAVSDATWNAELEAQERRLLAMVRAVRKGGGS